MYFMHGGTKKLRPHKVPNVSQDNVTCLRCSRTFTVTVTNFLACCLLSEFRKSAAFGEVMDKNIVHHFNSHWPKARLFATPRRKEMGDYVQVADADTDEMHFYHQEHYSLNSA